MKTAPLTPLGPIKGDTWERIYDYTVDAVYGANVLTGGTASADSVFTTYTADKALTADGWISVNSAFPHWWKYDFGVGVTKTISKVSFGTSYSSGARWKTFKVQGSNNDTDWTDLYDGVFPNVATICTFWFTNTTAYRYYRLHGTDNWDVYPYGVIHSLTAHEYVSGNRPATSLTISGLNGDVDEEYILESKVVNGYNGVCNVGLRPNNDSSASTHGCQVIAGTNTSVNASRGTSTDLVSLAVSGTLGYINQSTFKLFAKSGFVRTCINEIVYNITGTTIDGVQLLGQSWNNSADNITSLVIVATQTGGIGVGSSFQLYRKTRRS